MACDDTSHLGPVIYTPGQKSVRAALQEAESLLLSMMYEARVMYPGCGVAIDAIIAKTRHEVERLREHHFMRFSPYPSSSTSEGSGK